YRGAWQSFTNPGTTDMRSSQLAQTIANEISLLVTSGELNVGDHVKTQQLADRFGVSRSPVREAMEILAGQGLLEQKENRGFFVKEPPGAIAERVREDAEPFEVANDYQRLAEDWLTDRIPAEVTEQTLRERYELTKSQLNDVLMRA